jgi:hypothetical protein
MTTTMDRNRERRLRRLADKQRYRLTKLRGQDGYWLSDIDTGGLVIGEMVTRGVFIGGNLDEIEDWLRRPVDVEEDDDIDMQAYAEFCDYLQYDLETGLFSDEDMRETQGTQPK